jgi:hypothetical protein
MRINIDIADDEFDFIKAAIEHKTLSLITYMDRCKEEAELVEKRLEFPAPTPVRRGRPPAKKTNRRTRK